MQNLLLSFLPYLHTSHQILLIKKNKHHIYCLKTSSSHTISLKCLISISPLLRKVEITAQQWWSSLKRSYQVSPLLQCYGLPSSHQWICTWKNHKVLLPTRSLGLWVKQLAYICVSAYTYCNLGWRAHRIGAEAAWNHSCDWSSWCGHEQLLCLETELLNNLCAHRNGKKRQMNQDLAYSSSEACGVEQIFYSKIKGTFATRMNGNSWPHNELQDL